MNAQILLSDIGMSSKTSVSSSNISAKTSVKSSKDTFQNVMNTVARDKNQTTDPGDKKTYAQVVDNSRAAAVKYKSAVSDTGKDLKISDNDKDVAEDKQVQSAADSVINGIALLLGIDSSSLKQLLSDMNVKPEDLLDSSKVNEIINQLSVKLGLSNEQEQVLLSSAQQFSKMAREATSTADQGKDWVVVENVAIDVIKKDNTQSSNATVTHLDEDIRQLVNSIKKDNSSLFENVPQKFSQIMEQFIDSKQLNKTETIRENAENKKDVKSDKDEKAAAIDSKAEATEEKSTLFEVKSQLQTNKETIREGNIAVLQANDNIKQNADNNEFITKLTNLTSQTRVVKNELMEQVVQQAKVLVDDNRSEMVMQLKPDSLGKLTLKIVTENGIVAAKFVAENQQVRQVLETNMQILKDSLEKQGMSIQNVSVSVGQEGNQNSGQREAFQRNQKNGKGYAAEDTIYVNSADAENTFNSNPYEISDNSIDVIA